MSWSICIVKFPMDCPAATALTMFEMPSCAPAMWCATTPTVHFSDAVVFFQSASLRRSSTPVASCTFVSNCFASASALAAMGSSLVRVVGVCLATPIITRRSSARPRRRAQCVLDRIRTLHDLLTRRMRPGRRRPAALEERAMGHRTLRLAALALVVSLVGSGVGSQERDPVKIGLIFTNTGPLAQLGIDMRDGNLLYWSQVGGRAGGRRVELLTESTGSNKPDEGLTKARKLVERDHAQILTGVLETPVAYALAPYVNDRKIPLMINIAGADGLSQKQRSEYVFRSSFSNSQASHPLGEWAYRQGYRKMVLLASDFAAGHEHIGGVARTFVAAGGHIIQEIYPPLGASDFAPYLAQIRRDADVVAVAIFGADALRVVAQYTEFGLKGKIPLIGKGGLTDESFLDKMGDAALGIVVAFNWSAALDTPENRRFREAFESKYKRPVSLTAEAGYVGAQMIARALESTKGNVESLDAFLAALRAVEVDAPRGKVKLDSFHNPLQTVYILKTERKDGVLQNVPIATYPNTSQFWTWTPDAFMAMPSYVEMKGKWAR